MKPQTLRLVERQLRQPAVLLSRESARCATRQFHRARLSPCAPCPPSLTCRPITEPPACTCHDSRSPRCLLCTLAAGARSPPSQQTRSRRSRKTPPADNPLDRQFRPRPRRGCRPVWPSPLLHSRHNVAEPSCSPEVFAPQTHWRSTRKQHNIHSQKSGARSIIVAMAWRARDHAPRAACRFGGEAGPRKGYNRGFKLGYKARFVTQMHTRRRCATRESVGTVGMRVGTLDVHVGRLVCLFGARDEGRCVGRKWGGRHLNADRLVQPCQRRVP
jgi:hypothetical protein